MAGHGGGGQPESAATPEATARAICLRLLSAAPRTRAQLAEVLRRRNVPAAAAETVLGRLTDVGLIDDAAFAAAWVQTRHRGRGLSRRTLAGELRSRGIPAETVAGAVEALDPEQELHTARAMVERRLGTTAGLPVATRVRRLAGMLVRRGYPPGVASRLVHEALDVEAEGSASSLVEDYDEG